MRVLTINLRIAVIVVVALVMIITGGVIFIYGNDENAEEKIPEIEIVLP